MAGYIPLPAARNPENAMLDFSPLNQAVSGFKDAQRQNSMLEYQAGRDKIQDARAGAAASRADERWAMEKDDYQTQKQAALVKNLAGVAQLVDQDTDPASRQQKWQRVVASHPSLAANMQKYGVDPSDHVNGPKFLIAEARGYQDPMASRKAEAEIAKTQAETGWYNERPRTAAGGATNVIIDRLLAENPSMTYEQAVTIAKRGAGVMRVGDELANRNTGETVRNVGANIAAEKAQEEIGTATGKATASAPADLTAAYNALDIVGKIRAHPGRQAGTGASSVGNIVWGTQGYDFQTLVDQAKSGAFLTAIQQMRGLGALSNAEGQTATQAVTRMNTATTEEGFLEAVNDYETIVRQGIARAQQRMNTPPGQVVSPPAHDGWTDVGGVKIREKR